MDRCPICSGASGAATVYVEAWEWKGPTFLFSSTQKYLVRSVTVPGICAGCSKNLVTYRLIADVLAQAPMIFCLAMALLFGAQMMFVFAGFFLLQLFRELSYNWADRLVYGSWLEAVLAPHVPQGDPGRTRFPASAWHVLIRLGTVPGAFVGLVVAAGVVASLLPRPAAPATPAPPPVLTAAEQVERARAILTHEPAIAVPVAEAGTHSPSWDDLKGNRPIAITDLRRCYGLRIRPIDGRPNKDLIVYTSPRAVPPTTLYVVMSGPQLASEFAVCNRGDRLVIEDGTSLALPRAQVEALAAGLPPPPPVKIHVTEKRP